MSEQMNANVIRSDAINELLEALGDMGASAVASGIKTEQRRMGDTLVRVIWARRSLDAVSSDVPIASDDPAHGAYVSILAGTNNRRKQRKGKLL